MKCRIGAGGEMRGEDIVLVAALAHEEGRGDFGIVGEAIEGAARRIEDDRVDLRAGERVCLSPIQAVVDGMAVQVIQE